MYMRCLESLTQVLQVPGLEFLIFIFIILNVKIRTRKL
jgi:hypothetical protein